LLLLVSLILAAGASLDARVYGTKKPGVKGRYLEVESGVNLGDYAGALLILEPAEIVADKDRPVDTESVRTVSGDSLSRWIRTFFPDIVSEVPLELPDREIVRARTRLTLQHGSQAMRYWVGMGAGKSKLHVAIEFMDARTGKRIAYFNGYGSGSGAFSWSGGGVQRMARDDLSEIYTKLAEYLRAAGAQASTPQAAEKTEVEQEGGESGTAPRSE